MRILISILVLLFLTITPAAAASLEETFQQAQAAFKAGNWAQAGELFTQAGDLLYKRKDAAKAGLVWGNAAVARIKAEDFATAAQLYERILATNKKLPPDQALRVYKNLVLCRGKLGQRALQIAAIDNMLKAIPKLPPAELSDVYARQGDAYRAMELYGPATSSYDKAAYVLPKDATPAVRAKILTAMGLCQGNMGNFSGAAKNLVEARKLADTTGESLTIAESDSNLGILYWERGEYPDAMKLLKTALTTEEQAKLRRNEGVDLNNLGLVYKSVGSHQEAISHFQKSLAIAREVGNVRDQAIAMVNLGLLHRITGQLKDARADYNAAMKLFEQCGFQEGIASTHLGIGKMTELEDRNYTLALEHYNAALEIYTRLALPRWQSVTFLQLGGLYKHIAAPKRATRDLVFDDDPTVPDISNTDALTKSREYYAKALEIAEPLQSREVIWAAHQGLGYTSFREGKLEAALQEYEKAIDIVTKMYVSLETAELLGEFMADKEDLYQEAQEVSAALYEKTKDKKYLDLQLRYAETLRNEVQKASAALMQMQFEDKAKQEHYEKLNKLGREWAKASKAIPASQPAADASDPESKANRQLVDKAAKEQRARVQKLDADYRAALQEWKKKYPADANIFDSSARVDVATIQKHISPDQLVLQYVSLPDKLLIIAIAKDTITPVTVDVPKKSLDKLIRDDFLVGYIEGYGHGTTKIDPKQAFDEANVILTKLYNYLLQPVEASLEGKKRLYIVSDGFLAQTPFAALVSGMDEKGQPNFLIEKFEIAYVRPSFIQALERPAVKGGVKKLLAVGNPQNTNFPMDLLPGTIDEIGKLDSFLKLSSVEKDIAMETFIANDDGKKIDNSNNILKEYENLPNPLEKPTELWFHNKLKENNYEIIYFATHGMPYSNVVISVTSALKSKRVSHETKQKYSQIKDTNLKGNSPLNGFLYMSTEGDDDILKKDIPTERDGLLTIKEIMELPDTSLKGTHYVVLSACNTGVTFVPLALKKNLDTTDDGLYKTSEKELRDMGWVPGVDQIGFVDLFMRRGVSNVYGTLWFADDASSSKLMADFASNLVAQGDHPDAVAAFTKAQRDFVKEGKEGKGPAAPFSHHPFFWAVGAMFGK